MTVEEINEPIRVRADFSAGGAHALRITRINARWEDRSGTFKRYHFSVEAEGNVFEMHLDSRNLSWHLDRVCLEG